jgi:hypothetical protein
MYDGVVRVKYEFYVGSRHAFLPNLRGLWPWVTVNRDEGVALLHLRHNHGQPLECFSQKSLQTTPRQRRSQPSTLSRVRRPY